MTWGPQENPPNSAMNIQQGDPQVAVMLQRKSNLKTFLTKYSSAEKKMHRFLRVNGRAPLETSVFTWRKRRAEHDPSGNEETIPAPRAQLPSLDRTPKTSCLPFRGLSSISINWGQGLSLVQ